MDPAEPPPLSDFAPVVLRPQRTRAAVWATTALLALAAAAWFLIDMGPTLFTVGFLLLACVPVVWFGIQLVVPDQFTVRLEPDELEVQQFWRHRTVAWEHVKQARVVSSGGEPALEVSGIGGEMTVVLPLGADVASVHRFLRARLGVAPTEP